MEWWREHQALYWWVKSQRTHKKQKLLEGRALWPGCVRAHSVAKSCPAPCRPLDCRPWGSRVLGILRARTPEWAAIRCSRGASWLRDRAGVSYISCRGRQIPHHWATWEALCLGYLSVCMTPRTILAADSPAVMNVINLTNASSWEYNTELLVRYFHTH